MISPDNVKYIAGLARIHIEDKEINRFTLQLEKILHYIDQLNKLDISAVEPTSHVLSLENVYRDDNTRPPLPREDVLRLAVEQHNGFFKVPPIIE